MNKKREKRSNKLILPNKQLLQEMARIKGGPEGLHFFEYLEECETKLNLDNSVLADDFQARQGQGAIQVLTELLYYFQEGRNLKKQ